MRKLRLLKLRIENFRGIKELDLKFEGEDKVLAGTNEVGKTTVADAYSWLISDKDSKGNSQFAIKPLDKDNNEIHHLNTIVEGKFQILKDGKFEREFDLKKDYHEKWTRKRGSTTEEFTGHTTDYMIDEVPENKGDYEDYIDNIIDYETLKLISDPLYFSERLHWKDQREIIYSLANRPDPTEVAAEVEKYYLAEKLENSTTDKHQKKLKSKMKKINKELEKIPARIDENHRKLKDLDVGDKQELTEQLNTLQEELDKLQEQRAELKNNSQSSTMKKIIDLKADLQNLKEDKLEKANNRLDQYRNEKKKLDKAKTSHEQRIANLKNEIKMQEERKSRAKRDKKELLEMYHEEDKKVFNEDKKICSRCGQELPADRIEEIKAAFNKKKSNTLADIKARGKKKAKIIEEAENNIKEALAGVEDIQSQIDNLEYEPIEEGLEKGEEYKRQVKENELPELKQLADKIEELQDSKSDGEPVDLTDINFKIVETRKEIKAVEEQLANAKNKEEIEERIEELQEKEQELVNNYEVLEKELYDLEKYIKAEIRMMEEDINNQFEIVEFKLFDKQVNGAINETCEAMKNGVPYSELNTGSQYQAGLDIIRTLSDKYEFEAPVIIDNRERIARLPEVDSQTIQLVMTPDRTKLEMINLADEDAVADFVEEEAGIKRESLF